MIWFDSYTELDPPEVVVPYPTSTIHLGWRHHLGLDWRLDAVLCRASWRPYLHFLPAVVVSPLIHLPLDLHRVRDEFGRWVAGVATANRMGHALAITPVPGVSSLLMHPLTGPLRTFAPVRQSRAYWCNRLELEDQGDGP